MSDGSKIYFCFLKQRLEPLQKRSSAAEGTRRFSVLIQSCPLRKDYQKMERGH